MDDFVSNAFRDAHEALAEEEYKAYARHFGSDEQSKKFNMTSVLRTGIEDMTVFLADLDDRGFDTFSRYIANLVINAFHEGYIARMEDER